MEHRILAGFARGFADPNFIRQEPGLHLEVDQRRIEKIEMVESALEKHLKGDPHKVRIALRLRKETTMTLSWIAQRLRMGTKTHVSHLLYWHNKKQ